MRHRGAGVSDKNSGRMCIRHRGTRGYCAHIPVTSLARPVGDCGFDGGVRYEQEVGETDHEVIVRDTQPPTAEREWCSPMRPE